MDAKGQTQFLSWSTLGKWRFKMAGKKNNLSAVINQLARGRVQGFSQSLRATKLLGDSNGPTEKLEHPISSSETKGLSMNSRVTSESIGFGSPSSTKASTSQTGSAWTDLLKQTASGGVASVLGGGLAGFGGLGSLISGIAGLFGGASKTAPPPPLVRFQLPNSQDQTAYLNSSGSMEYQGQAVESPSRPESSSIYGTGVAGNQTAQPLRYQSAEIAQAVKSALLNSSSLNDVIAEI